MKKKFPFNIGFQELPGKPMYCPEDLPDFVTDKFRAAKREVFGALILDSDFHLMGLDVISCGSEDSASFKPTDIFREVILKDGTYIVLIHNHPNERKVVPSENDNKVTEMAAEMCRIMHLPLLDHCIIGSEVNFSYRLHGKILKKAKKYRGIQRTVNTGKSGPTMST